jgi:hypothetical protein
MQETIKSPLYRQVADVLSRARKLPVGPSRNDLRQLAVGLRWLDKKGQASNVEGQFSDLPTTTARTA